MSNSSAVRLMAALEVAVAAGGAALIWIATGLVTAGAAVFTLLYFWTGFLLWLVLMPTPPDLSKAVLFWLPACICDKPEWLERKD